MQVKLLTDLNQGVGTDGLPNILPEGTVVEVNDEQAQKWIENGVAADVSDGETSTEASTHEPPLVPPTTPVPGQPLTTEQQIQQDMANLDSSNNQSQNLS